LSTRAERLAEYKSRVDALEMPKLLDVEDQEIEVGDWVHLYNDSKRVFLVIGLSIDGRLQTTPYMDLPSRYFRIAQKNNKP
jgi:hypothetical protein